MRKDTLVGGESAAELYRTFGHFTIEVVGPNAYHIRGRLPEAERRLFSRALKTIEAELASTDPKHLGLRPEQVSPERIGTTAFTLLVVRVSDALGADSPS